MGVWVDGVQTRQGNGDHAIQSTSLRQKLYLYTSYIIHHNLYLMQSRALCIMLYTSYLMQWRVPDFDSTATKTLYLLYFKTPLWAYHNTGLVFVCFMCCSLERVHQLINPLVTGELIYTLYKKLNVVVFFALNICQLKSCTLFQNGWVGLDGLAGESEIGNPVDANSNQQSFLQH